MHWIHVIIAFYKAEENEPTVEAVFQSWIDEKLGYGEIQKQISITQFMGDLELSRRMFKRVVKRG